MDGIILEHIDYVIEVNEGDIDGDSIHFVRVKGPLVIRYPMWPYLCLRNATGTAEENAAVG